VKRKATLKGKTTWNTREQRTADENEKRKITTQPLFKNYKRRYIYSPTEDSEAVRNGAGFV
jgi:hypothetical protein